MRMTSRTASARRILGDLKKSVSRVETCRGRRRLAFASSLGLGQVLHEMWGGGADEKARIERLCLSLSPYVEEPLNSKGNKKFRT